jgi:hypothetical protein
LAGALDAAAGALAAWEEGALDATEDLGGWTLVKYLVEGRKGRRTIVIKLVGW